MEERKSYFDNLKAILIILVVVGHIGYYNSSTNLLQTIELFIYLFHMPLFVFVSGYFSKNLDKARNKAFKDYFFVFIIMNFLWGIFSLLFNNRTYLKNIFEPGISLWYIMALFIWRYFLKDLTKIKHILPISFIISLLPIFMINIRTELALNRVLMFLPYFLLGFYCTEENINKIRKIPKKISFIILLFIFACIYIVLQKNILSFDYLFGILSRTAIFYTMKECVIAFGLHLILIIVTILSSICILSLVSDKKTYLTNIGNNTLPLYLSQPYVQMLYEKSLDFFIFDYCYLNYGISIVISIICVIVFSTNFYREKFMYIINKAKKMVFTDNE